ncbi:cobaltochelatase CobT-related protein [Parasedimentitalea huanghaiensis]|uniref:cobaltochelatase CobT-related protein n=1 Tax=Parasedimentitalea huanghaiensis TaxID=2682100 RepID=UPI00142F7001
MKKPWESSYTGSDYKIFTTENDIYTSALSLWADMSPQRNLSLNDQWLAYENVVGEMRMMAAFGCQGQVDTVLENPTFTPSRTAVSIVVAQAGPLSEQRATQTLLLVEVMSDFLDKIGVQYETLGFTTVDWNGGKSRQKWLNSGRPKNPGRLNDVTHIVYRDASSATSGALHETRSLLRGELFKESIDGEALFWAAERLKALNTDTNLVLMISDRAPTDAGTLQENGPDFLLSHLKSVIEDLQATPGFSVVGIGIEHDVSTLYETNLKVGRLDQLPTDLLRFLSNLFA